MDNSPTPLPNELQWITCDVKREIDLAHLRLFLEQHYFDGGKQRPQYGADVLLWALTPPGYLRELHCAIASRGRLVGFIAGIPVHLQQRRQTQRYVAINFLCVHRQWRERGLARTLIDEVTRRGIALGLPRGIYTGVQQRNAALGPAEFWHCPLQAEPLYAASFLPAGCPAATPALAPNVRPLQIADYPTARTLLNEHLARFPCAQWFSAQEFAHWFADPVRTWVREQDGRIIGLSAYYPLPTIAANGRIIRAAYRFYECGLECGAAARACHDGFHVLTVVDWARDPAHLRAQQFCPGTGRLWYYHWPPNTAAPLPGITLP